MTAPTVRGVILGWPGLKIHAISILGWPGLKIHAISGYTRPPGSRFPNVVTACGLSSTRDDWRPTKWGPTCFKCIRSAS